MAATPGPSGYHLLKKIALGGEGGWDALAFDSATRRLFISRQSKVIVVNVDSEKVVGKIPSTDGVHDIALANEFNKGFTSNGRAGTVTIFDLKMRSPSPAARKRAQIPMRSSTTPRQNAFSR